MKLRGILILVSFSAFLAPFSQTVYMPMLPEIQRGFNTTPMLTNLSISFFTLTIAFTQLLYGPIVDRKGRRSTLITGTVIYIAGCVGCALSPTMEWLIAFRLMQAAGIAAGSVVATTVIGDLFEGKARERAMGTFQMIVSSGFVLGPFMGGLIGGGFGYRTIFITLIVIGLTLLLLIYKFLHETQPSDLHPRGIIPIRDFRMVLRNPMGRAIILLALVQYFSFYTFLVLLPDMLTHNYGLTAQTKGATLLPLTLSFLVGTYLGGRVRGRMKPFTMLLLLSAMNVLCLILFMAIAQTTLAVLIINIALFGLSFGLGLPLQTSLLTSIFTKERATAVGIYNFARFFGMGMSPIISGLLYHTGYLELSFGFATAACLVVVLFTYHQYKRAGEGIEVPITN